MKDKALEELFLAQKPHFDDKTDFMASLTRRLDAVEYVRLAAFVIGIISGTVTLAFILSMPADIPLFTIHVQSGILLWLVDNSRIISATILALLISLGLMSIASNIQDIMRIQKVYWKF